MGIIGVISQSPVEAGQASTSSSNIGLMIVPELLARGIGRVAHSGDLPCSVPRSDCASSNGARGTRPADPPSLAPDPGLRRLSCAEHTHQNKKTTRHV